MALAQINETIFFDADQEKDQVAAAVGDITLEANVVQIILNDEHRSGVDWGAIVSDYHTIPLKKEDNPIWADKKYRLNIGTVSLEDYAVLLEALDTVGRMTQFAQAPVMAAMGQDVKVPLHLSAPQPDAAEKPEDMRIDALLAHLPSGEVSLHLEPHLTMLANEIKEGRKLPTVMALKAQTDLPLRTDAVIVIGGIIKEEEITRLHKFPLLGDLPLVGLVFRNQGRLMQKTETIIFLTPRLNAVQVSEDKMDVVTNAAR